MRILILCGATFAVGLLAGSLFWSESDLLPTRTTQGSRSANGVGAVDDDIGWTDEETAGGGSSTSRGTKRFRNADVRTLTAEAAEELERIKSSERAEAFLDGDGKVAGTVRDPAGEPVEGVIVTAVPDAQPSGLSVTRRRARQRPHEDRDLPTVAQEAIQRELWRRYARRSATTGANGRFEMEGLTDSRHTITAYHDDYDINPLSQRGKVQPDAVVDFLARPVVEVRVEVRMPDGALADYAWLRWEGPHGRGGGAWNQDLDTVRLPIGSSKVKAQTWLPAPMESAEVERVISAIKSDEVLVLELKGRRVLTARLALPKGLVLPRTVEYKIRRLVGAEEVDPKSLARAKSQHRASSPTAGRAAWYDLEPGRYLVAAFLNRRRLIGHATAEVTDGATEVELPASELDAGTYVTVRLLGPDGGPVPGQSSFRVIPEGGRSQRVDALQADDGSWLVFTDVVAAKGANDATLRVGTRDFGGQTHPVSLGAGGSITMRFGKPARLAVQIEGYGESGVEGSLYVALRSKLGADAWRAVSSDGSCELNGVQPGDYTLNLYLRKNNRNWSIYQRRVDLRSGEDEMTLPMPILHTLRVRWTGKGRPRNVVLRCKDESVGTSRRDARLKGRVATFNLVAAGSYEIECARKRVTTRVPGPEVTLP